MPLKSAAFEKIKGISLQQEASVDWWESQKGCKGDESACIINNVKTLFSFSVDIRKQAKSVWENRQEKIQRFVKENKKQYYRVQQTVFRGR